MKKIYFIFLLTFLSKYIFQQKIVLGTDFSLSNAIKVRHNIINIDTNFYNGNNFYITNLNLESKIDGPALFAEFWFKNGVYFGTRGCYSSAKYTEVGNGNSSKYFPNLADPDEFKQRYVNARFYLGKEFLQNKLLRPFFFVGVSRYKYLYHKFYEKTSATLSYNYTNYENWLKENFKSISTLSLGAGINLRYIGISFYHDRTLTPINGLIRSYSNISYLTLKFNFFSRHISKRIPLTQSKIETLLAERAYITPSVIGLAIEHPFNSSLEIAKDSVTGYEFAAIYDNDDNDAMFVDGYIFDGFTIVEIKKNPTFQFSPTITLYREKSIRNSSKWFMRNAIGYRFFRIKYERAVTNLAHNLLFLANDPAVADLAVNTLSLKNEYSAIAQEHKIGYRILKGNKPNYFTLNAGIRINWRIRHWNTFTSKIRFILPTASAGIMYKMNRFSIGLTGEHSILTPDKKGYYRRYYGINGQLNFDIFRSK